MNAAKSKDLDNSDDEQCEAKSKEKQKAHMRNLFGVFPLYKAQHSFKKKRDGQTWPSDRMSSCEEIRKKTETEMALVIESRSPRYLSWMQGLQGLQRQGWWFQLPRGSLQNGL